MAHWAQVPRAGRGGNGLRSARCEVSRLWNPGLPPASGNGGLPGRVLPVRRYTPQLEPLDLGPPQLEPLDLGRPQAGSPDLGPPDLGPLN